ncbi:cobalt-zinc-cadmium resistance protein [Rhodovibrio sodomensis]|uniref:Cobalt-zinc-cadmium resistance protein n=2 Tax=Rhodovibrio sodomensis TaxID=1088 RepID=A0ABS1DMN5_9PROT|nr:cobalt-zinc-cadmium resistance protein [Rhodovibrio sodomensis]
MARHRVAPNLLMAVLLIGGLLMSTQIKQEVFPAFQSDTVIVQVAYPGASPAEVEQGVILAIEQAVQGIIGIDEVRSTAREGMGTVTAEVQQSADYQQVYQKVQQAVDSITTLPDDAEEPQIKTTEWQRDVLDLQLYGDVDRQVLRTAAERVRDALIQHRNISQVGLEGIREYRIWIDVPQAALRSYDLTLQEVRNVVAQSALDRAGGSLETGKGEFLVRLKERKEFADEFARIAVVTSPSGSIVRLGDIAEVSNGFSEADQAAWYNGKPAIGIEVFRVGSETPQGVSEATRSVLPEVMAELPRQIDYAIQDDNSKIYQQRVDLLLKNGFIGLCLVLLLLSLFLEFKLAFWVTVGIPVAFLGTFIFLPAFGVSINMVSLFAFILALGIVVDDAIVAGENIYEHRQRGMGAIEAAIHGARDIAVPISFSILTNIVAFLPMAMIPGSWGQIWAVIPAVVATALVISWVEALFILPAHLGHVRERGRSRAAVRLHALQRRFADAFQAVTDRVFAPSLAVCMRLRYLTVAVAVAILAIIVAIPMSGRMGFILMPEVESSVAEATAVLPVGVPDARTRQVRERMIEAAQGVLAENGGDRLGDGTFALIQGNQVEIRVYLTDPGVRPISTQAFIEKWRAAVGELSGVNYVRYSSQGGPGGGPSVSVELSHPDIDTLERAAEDLAGRLDALAPVRDVSDGTGSGKPQLDITLTSEARALDLTAAEIGRQVRGQFYGLEAVKQQRGRNEVTAMVRAPRSERDGLEDIEEMLIRVPGGGSIPLQQAADVTRDRAYTEITRRNGRRTITVTANVNPIEATSRVTDTLRQSILPQMARDYPGLDYTFGGRQESMRQALESFLYTVSAALFLIFALLAIPLRSYVQPLIVMAAIPFGVVGAIIGHLIMGYALSIISIMGMIALGGVVVNGALVMIDYANRRLREGHDVFTAMHMAGVRRFRPIVLTTLTTFGGLAPMIFETSRQARFLIPMALSLGFGILFATAILLALTPCLYLVLDDIRRLPQRLGLSASPRAGAPAE